MKARVIAALSLAALAAAPVAAQENIVVTASRISARLSADSSNSYVVPGIGVTRRPDNLLRTLYVSCDTREAEARLDELRRTLRGMLERAEADGAIELSRLVGIDDDAPYDDGADVVVEPFTEEAIEGGFQSNWRGRTDTSYIQLQVKTPIGADDTLASASRRLEAFVARIPVVGRSELLLDDDDVLTIVDPQQYRGAIFEAMSADANARLAELGEGHGARFEGLENQVAWYRSGVLELKLFIPHRLAILPRDQ
jgi:hypothetical protein